MSGDGIIDSPAHVSDFAALDVLEVPKGEGLILGRERRPQDQRRDEDGQTLQGVFHIILLSMPFYEFLRRRLPSSWRGIFLVCSALYQ
jgi:hypothetical protein